MATPNTAKRSPINSLVLIPVQDTNRPMGDQFGYIASTDLANNASQGGGVVTTVAEFRASDDIPTNVSVITTDHGGGTWYYVGIKGDDDPTVDDTGSTIITADNHIWKRIFDGSPNPIHFGAMADGVTNDKNAIENTLNYLYQNGGGELTFPAGQFFIGYTDPLVIVGGGLVIKGSGSTTNANLNSGTSILGRIEIGTIAEGGQTNRVRISDISIIGQGVSDQLGTSHTGVGITIIKGLEANFYNVSVEGFKYGVAPYDTPDASILYAYSVTFDHCRFYNNRICNFEWGRVGHALTLIKCNLSWSDYNIVFGVFNHTTDTIIWSNAEPNLTLNVISCVIQGWRQKGIVITNSKKGSIRSCYFELGKPNADVTEPINIDSDEAIQLGSSVAADLIYSGMEDNAMNWVIDDNWFYTATLIYQYKSNFCCIRVINAKKGSITNNLLNNIPYPTHSLDNQLGNIVLIRTETAKLNEDVVYESNSAVWCREKTEEYAIEDSGFSSFHATYKFKFVRNRPLYLSDAVANKMYYDGVQYDIFYLGGGTDQYSADAEFGPTVAQTLKLPQVINPKTTITA